MNEKDYKSYPSTETVDTIIETDEIKTDTNELTNRTIVSLSPDFNFKNNLNSNNSSKQKNEFSKYVKA